MAYLALQPRRVPRALVAGTLWVEGSQQRANGNLRSSLWRLNKRAKDLVDARAQTLSLVSSAWVDTNEVSEASGKLHANGRKASDAELHPDRFAQELLPGWYDEWAMVERERLRQVSLRALEVISERLEARQRYGMAVAAAIAAIGLDPLRESAHRRLISIHLAEGDRPAAIRHYDEYTCQLRTHLGIQPSPRLRTLVE